MVADPWSGSTVPKVVEEEANNMKFEDDFNQMCRKEKQALDDNNLVSEDYVALDDSDQYLARLERKLNRVTGSSGPSGSRSLLAGLAASRQAHHHALLVDTGAPPSSVGESDDLPRARGVLLSESQQHLNSIMQKLAPEKLALSAEELVKLLAADSLAATTEGDAVNRAPDDTDTTMDGSNNRLVDASPESSEVAEQGTVEDRRSSISLCDTGAGGAVLKPKTGDET